MANNIEIKARAAAYNKQFASARDLADAAPISMSQRDTFFNVETGRLKLREFDDAAAQLIFYQRSDAAGPTCSDYQITEVPNPQGVKDILSTAYGVRRVVTKQRVLLMVGRTRIHFDCVDDLGKFIELEVVLTEGDSISEADLEAKQLMESLAIEAGHLVDVAYVDLLERAA